MVFGGVVLLISFIILLKVLSREKRAVLSALDVFALFIESFRNAFTFSGFFEKNFMIGMTAFKKRIQRNLPAF